MMISKYIINIQEKKKCATDIKKKKIDHLNRIEKLARAGKNVEKRKPSDTVEGNVN